MDSGSVRGIPPAGLTASLQKGSHVDIVDIAATARHRPGIGRRRDNRDNRALGLALVLGAQLMIILDLTVVNIALPSIATACTSPRPACPGCSTPTR